MLKILNKSTEFRVLAITITVFSSLASLALVLHLIQPQIILINSTPGGGSSAQLTPNMFIEQRITSPNEATDKIFALLDTPRDGQYIQAQIQLEHSPHQTSLGYGHPIIMNKNKKKFPGVVWALPDKLKSDSDHIVRLSLSNTADHVKLIADERSQDSPNAASIITSDNKAIRQNFSLSLAFAEEKSRWSTKTTSEQQNYMQIFQIILFSTILTLSLILAKTFTPRNYKLKRRAQYIVIGVLIVGAIAGRGWLASQLPLVNDEQFYIHDAVLYDPEAPQFWKTPILITALKGWISVTGIYSLLAIRYMIICSSVIALSIFAYIAYRIGGKIAGWATLIIGYFMPVVMSYTSLVMTEQFMLLPIAGATLFAFLYRDKKKIAWWQLILVSILIGAATAIRWSALFWLVPIVLILWNRSWKELGRRILWLISPFLASSVVFLLLFPNILSEFQIGGIFLEFFERSQQQGWLDKFLTWRQPTLRLSLLLILSLITFSGTSRKQRITYATVATGFALLFFPAWQEGLSAIGYPVHTTFLFCLVALFLLTGLTIPTQYKFGALRDAAFFLIPPLMAYAIFHKVNDKYLAEFIPALVIFAGLGFATLLESLWNNRRLSAGIGLLILFWLVPPWLSYPLRVPYAGTISLDALDEVVNYISNNIAPEEKVLTASSLIPLLADREPAYEISHPSWLAPTFRGKPDPRFYALLDPIAVDIEERRIPWILDGKLTSDTYRRHPAINAAINTMYEPVIEIDNNGSQALTILQLRK